MDSSPIPILTTDHLKKMLQEVINLNELSDVTLISDDSKFIKAHKVILSAVSPTFKEMFLSMPQTTSVIFLRGINHLEIESILEFIYLGQTSIHQERIDELLNVAEIFGLQDISQNVKHEQEYFEEIDYENEEMKEDLVSAESNNSPDDFEKEIEEDKNIEISKKLSNSICPECNKSFFDDPTLSKHLKAVHIGIKHKCEVCDKEFTQKTNLRFHHLSVHEGMMFHCKKCEYSAKTNDILKLHNRSVHMGINHYCTECDYQSTVKNNVKNHMINVHERSWSQCTFCKKQFKQESTLERHIMKKHK